MPKRRSPSLPNQVRFSHELRTFALPNEVTGSGLLTRRGWKWWISRRILWFLFTLFRGRRYGRLVLEKVHGIPVVVFPEVFHPGLFLSTPLLLDTLEQLALRTNSSVLDLGTGTEICAIFLAMRGARVTATDISPLAVRCAKINVTLNRVEDPVHIIVGDLFMLVARRRFDLVIFNPPYYEEKPKDWSEYAWRGENVIGRFIEDLGAHLAKDGRALLSVSTELDLAAVKENLHENGFEVRELRRRRLPGETMFVYECVRSSAHRL